MKAETFFSEAEKKDITASVREVEAGTAGEVAVMVVDRSDSYPEGRILAGVVIGPLPALLTTDLFWHDSMWIFAVGALLLALLCGRLAALLPPLHRFFIPGTRLDEQVRNRALTAFYEQGLHRTREESGVLFFISLFEHKVWVLADRGIYEKIDREILEEYAHDIARGIKTGKAAEALCREIRRVGKLLAEHFPVREGDVNELADRVIIGGVRSEE